MHQPRRILHLIASLDGYALSRQLQLLAEHQKARGELVELVALSANPRIVEKFAKQGIPCTLFHRRWKRDPLTVARLARHLSRSSAAIWHVWGRIALGYFNVARPRRQPSLRIVTLEHDRLPMKPLKRFDVVVISQPQGMSPVEFSGRAHVIAPGVPAGSELPSAREALLSELHLPQDSALIAVTGALTRDVQLDEAIWCFELVRTLHPWARMLILGSGPDRNRLERFARSVSEPGTVCFLEDRFDRHVLLPAMDIYWQVAPHGRYWQEIVEAMVHGLPVVASDHPNHQQLIIPNETGFLSPPNNRSIYARTTLELLEDPSLADRLGDAAKLRMAELYSLEKFTAAYDRLYAEM